MTRTDRRRNPPRTRRAGARRPRRAGPGHAPPVPGPAAPRPRITRRRTGSVVGGVAGGVADHLGVDVFRVRLVFTLLCGLGGAGFVAYVGLWLFCPLEPVGARRVVGDRERQQGAALVVLGVGLGIALSTLGGTAVGWLVGPLGVALVGVVVVWREADTDGVVPRARRGPAGLRGPARFLTSGGVAGGVRLVVGALLVTGGITVFLLRRLDLTQVQFGLLAALATLVGVAVLTVPWWLRLARELTAERRARVRDQERAEIAAHLHDSVLQTLVLIQKQAGEDVPGREVRRLARRQERELRSWLYGRTGSGPGTTTEAGGEGGAATAAGTVAGAVAAAAAEVEDAYGVTVTPVTVGDADLDDLGDAARALVAAAREAMVNAAKHSGAEEISVYAEVDPEAVEVFVRDRGRGFDPDQVPAARHGLADSIRGRMTRHGGRVTLRAAPGEGTEVGLVLPREGDGAPSAPSAPSAAASTPSDTKERS